MTARHQKSPHGLAKNSTTPPVHYEVIWPALQQWDIIVGWALLANCISKVTLSALLLNSGITLGFGELDDVEASIIF